MLFYAEKGLQEKNDLLEKVYDSNIDLIALSDLKGNFTLVGKSHEILGYDRDSLVGKNVMEFVHPEDVDMVSTEFSQFLQSRENKKIEYRYRRIDGEYLWFETIGTLLYDEKRQPDQILFNTRNITERKQAEQALKESEEKFRQLFQMLGEGVGIVDENETFVFANRAASKIFQTNNLIGKNLFNFITDKSKKVIQEETNKRKFGEESIYDLDIVTELGEYRNIIVTATPYTVADNKYIGTFGVFRDITKQKQAQKALKESEEKFKGIFEHANAGIATANFDGRLTNVNKEFEKLLGYSQAELLNMTFRDFTHPDDIGNENELLEKLFKREIDNFRIEKRYIHKTGRTIWVDISVAAMTNRNGEFSHLIGMVKDINEKVKAEQALKESEAVIRKKLNAITEPKGDIGTLELADIIDSDELQALMDDFFSLTGIGGAIVDISGKILVSCDWIDICSKFHRVHPETQKNCVESDTILSGNVPEGTFKIYKCKNNMWDMATPIMVDKKHIGNIFFGQFLFEGEEPDKKLFREQAKKYEFDETAYLTAFDNIPRYRRETIDRVMSFYSQLAGMISSLSYNKIKLSREITQTKLAEKQLKESEEKHRILFENMIQGVVYQNSKDEVIYANNAAAEILGLSIDQLFGKSSFDPDWKAINEEGKELSAEEHPSVITLRTGKAVNNFVMGVFVPQLNKYRWININSMPIFKVNKEKLYQVITTFEDITERKQAEKERLLKGKLEREIAIAEEALKFKQNFLANMSHEIRTPLTGILGMADILTKTNLDDDQAEYLDTILQSGKNLREIINDVLDFSKIEAGKMQLKKRVFPIENLFNTAERLFKSLCKKPIAFQCSKGPKLPAYIKADENRITKVINNLISNAVKFTEKGEITLQVELQQVNPGTNPLEIKISVSDTGKGIHEERQENLFQPFTQIDDRDTRQFEGTGLGLSICKEIAVMHGGDIGLKSSPNRGSTFWFTFAAEEASPKNYLKTKSEGMFSKKPVNLKILLAEDKLVNQKVIKLLLNSLGHEVTLAENGEKALQTFEPEKFDLILMDIQMPVMDGIAATKALREEFTALPPIVGLSANAFEGDREKYMNKGLDEYLTKPFNVDDFMRVMDELFGMHENS